MIQRKNLFKDCNNHIKLKEFGFEVVEKVEPKVPSEEKVDEYTKKIRIV